jgi:hypothetical protein
MNAFYILVAIMRSESTVLFIVLQNLVTARYSDFLFDHKFLYQPYTPPSCSQEFVRQVIGDDNLIMGSCHIAHDCKIGNSNIFANNTLFAGHVVVEVSNRLSVIGIFWAKIPNVLIFFFLFFCSGLYSHCRGCCCPSVLSYWLFLFSWWRLCGILSELLYVRCTVPMLLILLV